MDTKIQTINWADLIEGSDLAAAKSKNGHNQEIASLTNGQYLYAEDETSLQEIYKNIDMQMTIKGRKTEVTAILAGASLLLLLLGGALSLIWFGRLP